MKRPFGIILSLLLAAAPASAQTATLVADIHPGPPAPGDVPVPRTFMPLPGGAAFFRPDAELEAAEILWATDGTNAGTRSLGSFPSPRFFGALPGLAFFLAGSRSEAGSGFRLWRTDGTDAGTFPLSPALEDAPVSAVFGGRLLMSLCLLPTNDCGLYASDGSTAGTVRLASDCAGELVAMQGHVYFFNGNVRPALWRTDGTPESTRFVRRLPPGSDPHLLSTTGSRLFFPMTTKTSPSST